MPAKIIVSYDGTANEDDAVALGRVFADAGADVSLAYVRHTEDSVGDTQGILSRGLQLLGDPNAATHVVTDRSTPEGLAALAEREQADVIVFCSDSHTAKGHVSIGNSAQRLLEGGRTAVAIAPVDFAETSAQVTRVVAVGDGDGGARETAESLAGALGAEVAPVAARTPACSCSTRAPTRPGPRLAQLLRRTPDRDRPERRAGAAARRAPAFGGPQRQHTTA